MADNITAGPEFCRTSTLDKTPLQMTSLLFNGTWVSSEATSRLRTLTGFRSVWSQQYLSRGCWCAGFAWLGRGIFRTTTFLLTLQWKSSSFSAVTEVENCGHLNGGFQSSEHFERLNPQMAQVPLSVVLDLVWGRAGCAFKKGSPPPLACVNYRIPWTFPVWIPWGMFPSRLLGIILRWNSSGNSSYSRPGVTILWVVKLHWEVDVISGP